MPAVAWVYRCSFYHFSLCITLFEALFLDVWMRNWLLMSFNVMQCASVFPLTSLL